MSDQTQRKVNRWIELAVAVIIPFAVLWGVMTTKINANEKDIEKLTEHYNTLLSMKQDISAMRVDIEWIKKNIK